MYNSVTEMHIALDHGLQHVSSNRKQSINGYFKDLALNYAVLQYVEMKSSNKVTGEGFEQNQKRYDDLKELKRVKLEVPTYTQNGLDEVFVIQPNDYYKLIGSTSHVLYNKLNYSYTTEGTTVKYKTLSFPNSYIAGATYGNFKITKTIGANTTTVIDIADYPNFPATHGHGSKFMYVNLLLNKYDNIHWQKWDDSILDNTFIIVDEDDTATYTLTYTGLEGAVITTNSVNQSINVTVLQEPTGEDPSPFVLKRKRNELLSSLYFDNIDENVQYNRNRHRKPLSKFTQNRIIIDQGRDFLVPFVDIEYLRKPTLIDHISGKTCELSITREVIDLAVQRLKAYIKDEGYQHVVNESQISE